MPDPSPFAPLRFRQIALLVACALAGVIVVGAIALAVDRGELDDESLEVGKLIVVLFLAPVALALVPGSLLQVGASPARPIASHARIAFAGGVVYAAGWYVVGPLLRAAGHASSTAKDVGAWVYWLAGPIALPPLAASLADRLRAHSSSGSQAGP